MSTTTIAPPAAAATTATAAARPAAVRWALARVEGRRLLTHPLLLLGMAFTVVLMAINPDAGDRLELISGTGFTFMGAAIWLLLVAGLAASRARRDGAQDFYDGQPVTPRIRTQAALLSLAWAGAAGAVVTAAGALVLTGFDGVLILSGERYALRPLELAQGPLYLVLAGTVGVLVGTWTWRVHPPILAALALFLPPLAWLPWIVFGGDVPEGALYSDWLVGASVAWHLVGLAGLAVLAAAAALARHDRRPRIAVLALAGLGAGVVGILLGWPTGG